MVQDFGQQSLVPMSLTLSMLNSGGKGGEQEQVESVSCHDPFKVVQDFFHQPYYLEAYRVTKCLSAQTRSLR